jgi:uncharacterized protein DUF4136
MRSIRTYLLLSLIAVSAYAQDVRYNFAAGQDFSRYKTYKWVQIEKAERLNQLADQQLKTAVEAGLAKKGLTKTDGETADLFIAYQPSVTQEKEYTSYNTDWGYGAGWGRGWYGGGMGSSMTTGETSTIHIGHILLDMYDSGEKKLVWRGTVSKALDTKAKPDKQTKNLNKAIEKLLKNYPPAKPKS